MACQRRIGFLQVLLTTRSSEALDRLASGGHLGGEENVPEGIIGMEVLGIGGHVGTE